MRMIWWAMPGLKRWAAPERWAVPTLRVLVLGLMVWGACTPARAEKWAGVDEAVVERVAAEHGREPAPGLLGEMEGDLQLFAFLVVGAAGGFAAGYSYRMLTERRRLA